MQQPHHHGSHLCSVRLVYQVVLLVLSTLQLGKVIFHHQRFSKLQDLWPLSRRLRRNLAISRVGIHFVHQHYQKQAVTNHNLVSYKISLLSSAILVCKRIFLHVTIHIINMLVALQSSTYFSPSSQLKYFFAGFCYQWDTLLLYYILLLP